MKSLYMTLHGLSSPAANGKIQGCWTDLAANKLEKVSAEPTEADTQ